MDAVSYQERVRGLLGTVIDVTVDAVTEALAHDIARAAFAEIERLQGVCSIRDERSELRRWLVGATSPGRELRTVAELALHWRERTGGAIDPFVGAVTAVWREAEERDEMPTRSRIDAAVAAANEAAAAVRRDGLERPPRVALDLDAVAKGWIVDRAVERAAAIHGVTRVTCDAGGDVRHVGPPTTVAIEDPLAPYDDHPPLARVTLTDGALATSGGPRRSRQIGDRRVNSVVDPRTGDPAEHTAQASVMAADAATADVLATALTALPVAEGVALVEEVEGAECLVVTHDGELTVSSGWPGA